MDLSAIRALSFDCYGTLIDWETGILRAVRPVLSVRGLCPSDEEILDAYARLEALHESGDYLDYREVLSRVMRDLASERGASLEDREVERLPASLATWPAFPDTARTLRALATRFPLVICSNVDADLFEATQEKLGADFEWIVTADYCRSYKPNPRHLRVALALTGLQPHELLHVAQSRYHDIAPARALGIRTAWVNRPSRLKDRGVTPATPASASPAEPDLTATSLEELDRLLRALGL